jgi:hypothetical protein
MDSRILTRMFDSLDEDLELERFFSSIPSFCSSTLVEDPLSTFINPNEDKLLWALIGLMDHTSATHLVPNKIKQRRNAVCVRAMDATSTPLNEEIFDRIFSEEWNGLLSSVELWLFLRKRVDLNDPASASHAQCAISIIISREQERDHRWFEPTIGPLGVSGLALRNYLAHGDSPLLANCIYITRYIIDVYSREGWTHRPGPRSKILESVPIWTYGALSLGCSTTSVISGMKPSTRHKTLRPIIFHRSACLPLGIFVMPTSVYTKTLMQPRQHSRPMLVPTKLKLEKTQAQSLMPYRPRYTWETSYC